MTSTASPKAKQDYVVRVAALDGYVSLMQDLHLDGADMIRRAGLDPAVLNTPDQLVSYAAFLRALHIARTESGVPHIGLLLAERQSLSTLGPLGFTIGQAPDLRTAIQNLNEFYHLHTSGGVIRLVSSGDLAMWRYEVLLLDAPGIHQQEDLVLGLGMRIMRQLLGQDWTPELATLQRRAPVSITPYRQMFRCPVEFEAEFNQVAFDKDVLTRKLTHADSQLHAILNSHLKTLDLSGGRDFSSQVQQVIVHAIKDGDSSLPRVARLLGTSQRTLQRRLRDEGSGFRQELEAIRSKVATRYLEETQVPLTSLALTLGYSDLASFSHAFKKACGVSPSQWRVRAAASQA